MNRKYTVNSKSHETLLLRFQATFSNFRVTGCPSPAIYRNVTYFLARKMEIKIKLIRAKLESSFNFNYRR